jgi:hypothetical protein
MTELAPSEGNELLLQRVPSIFGLGVLFCPLPPRQLLFYHADETITQKSFGGLTPPPSNLG